MYETDCDDSMIGNHLQRLYKRSLWKDLLSQARVDNVNCSMEVCHAASWGTTKQVSFGEISINLPYTLPGVLWLFVDTRQWCVRAAWLLNRMCTNPETVVQMKPSASFSWSCKSVSFYEWGPSWIHAKGCPPHRLRRLGLYVLLCWWGCWGPPVMTWCPTCPWRRPSWQQDLPTEAIALLYN